MTNISEIMRQAQTMQAKLAQAQENVEAIEVDGVAGAGLVKVVLRGKGELVSVSIDPSLLHDEADIIEDLVKAAHADARKRLDGATEKAMKDATAGLGGVLPGFKMPF